MNNYSLKLYSDQIFNKCNLISNYSDDLLYIIPILDLRLSFPLSEKIIG